MIKAEFGIVEDIESFKEIYEPEKYNCIPINDFYINDWWRELESIETYFHSINRPSYALARYGITLIPPKSLGKFQEIILKDKRINTDDNLVELAILIGKAIEKNKFLVHYGV